MLMVFGVTTCNHSLRFRRCLVEIIAVEGLILEAYKKIGATDLVASSPGHTPTAWGRGY